MSEEQKVVDVEPEPPGAGERARVTEEIKVQAQDLVQAVKDLAHEGTIRRVTVLRNDRVLVDIPLTVGVAAGVILAIYLPWISALAAVGALLGGCTVRIEREEPAP